MLTKLSRECVQGLEVLLCAAYACSVGTAHGRCWQGQVCGWVSAVNIM